eukprot:SAG31_NODE_1755_length_7344_cov_7.207039_7_plen_92_part_00
MTTAARGARRRRIRRYGHILKYTNRTVRQQCADCALGAISADAVVAARPRAADGVERRRAVAPAATTRCYRRLGCRGEPFDHRGPSPARGC